MPFKIYIYVISVLLSTYALSGINFDKIMKKNKPLEARIIVLMLSFIFGYLLTNFITDFLSLSKLI
ncbi:MAG: DUF1146 domain-containing protein [Bacilli bacterium]|nr:DUF1146 domain-containing protein [Bacilli bacterium]